MTETKKPELQIRLQEALGLEDNDFGTYATDLYVVAKPGVLEWLKANYKYYRNITTFTGNPEATYWNGAGRLCLDIPFAGNWPERSGNEQQTPDLPRLE